MSQLNALANDLRNTKTAKWYAAQLGPGKAGRRRDYVRAVATVATDTGRPLNRAVINDEVGTSTSSTMYSLAGPRSLLNQHDEDIRRTQRYSEVVDLLVVETKVWSHWRHREGWLAELAETDTGPGSRQFAAETLVRVLVVWAARNPPLARMLDCAPPLSAVEDLLVICGDPAQLAERAGRLLSRVVRLALDPIAPSSTAVLDMVRDELDSVLSDPAPNTDVGVDLAVDLAERLTRAVVDLEYHLDNLPAASRSRLADELTPQLQTMLRKLGGPSA